MADGDGAAEGVDELHAHLEATEELPVDRAASRWIGEAQAVAADLVDGDVSRAVVETRVEHVRELLEHVDGTDHPEADDHVEAALDIARSILDDP